MTCVKEILTRAKELHIDLWVENNSLRVKGQGHIPPGMVTVLKANKPALLEYFRKTAKSADHEAYNDPLNFCSVCGAIVVEIAEIAGQPVGYCVDHVPQEDKSLKQDEIARRFSDELSGWNVEIEPRTTLRQKHFEQERDKWIIDPERHIPENAWHDIPPGATWQKVVDEARRQGDAFTGLNMGQWLKEGAS